MRGHQWWCAIRSLSQILDLCGKARNTLRTYARSLAFYFTFLRQRGLSYERVQIADLAAFVHWLKRMDRPMGPNCWMRTRSHRTINMHVGVVSGFYDHAWRTDQIDHDLNEKLRGQMPGCYRPYKAFLHHLGAYLEVMVAKGRKMDTLRGTITACAAPLQRYVDRHHGATDLRDLDAEDIDAYLTDRARVSDGEADQRAARAAQSEAARFVRFLEQRRDAGDPLIPAGFSIYPFRRRIALVAGQVPFRHAATGAALLPASLVAGALWDRVGPGAPFGYGAALAGLAVFLLLMTRSTLVSEEAGSRT